MGWCFGTCHVLNYEEKRKPPNGFFCPRKGIRTRDPHPMPCARRLRLTPFAPDPCARSLRSTPAPDAICARPLRPTPAPDPCVWPLRLAPAAAPFLFVPARRAGMKKLREGITEFSSLSTSAERRGFEPLKPFRGLLAFQAGQFNHSCIFPFGAPKVRNISRICKLRPEFLVPGPPNRGARPVSASRSAARFCDPAPRPFPRPVSASRSASVSAIRPRDPSPRPAPSGPAAAIRSSGTRWAAG